MKMKLYPKFTVVYVLYYGIIITTESKVRCFLNVANIF